jgi:hypothetical protein
VRVRRHAPLLVSFLVGAAIGLAFNTWFWGFFAFIVTYPLIQAGLDATERSARRSSAQLEDLVRGKIRDAGITEWRLGSGAGVFSEPVLVSWHSARRHELYDQRGKLLATARPEAGGSRVRRWLGSGALVWSMPDGRPLVTVSPDGKLNPGYYAASSPDGTELGTVIVKGSEKGSLSVAGEVVGCLKRPPMRQRLRGNCPKFYLYDASLVEVGRITHRRRFARWTVLEVRRQAAQPLRNLLLAADAAVDYWEQPKG